MEIERKFLVKDMPDFKDSSTCYITQGYIALLPEVRIRSKRKIVTLSYFLTVKGEGTLSRNETEIKITGTAFHALLPLLIGKLVNKSRYNIPIHNGYVAELDIYKENLEGLRTVEVEFKTEDEAMCFLAPDWFGEEITDDNRYKNKNLSQDGLAAIWRSYES